MAKTWAILASSVAVTGSVAGGLIVWLGGSENTCGASVVAGGTAAIGGPFQLVDQLGQPATNTDVITGPTLVYFGYTFCPDVCPLDTARNAVAVDILADQGLEVMPVFITIDPERDTPEALADYVEVIHPNMIGLTGTLDQVDVASKAYKTYYRKNGEGEDYLMDHSTFSYLMSPSGFVDYFRRDVTPEDMADRIKCHVG